MQKKRLNHMPNYMYFYPSTEIYNYNGLLIELKPNYANNITPKVILTQL